MNKKKLAASIKRSRRKQLKAVDQVASATAERLVAALDALPLDDEDDEDLDAPDEERTLFDGDKPVTISASPIFWDMFSEQEILESMRAENAKKAIQ